jgi:hypothetical protein
MSAAAAQAWMRRTAAPHEASEKHERERQSDVCVQHLFSKLVKFNHVADKQSTWSSSSCHRAWRQWPSSSSSSSSASSSQSSAIVGGFGQRRRRGMEELMMQVREGGRPMRSKAEAKKGRRPPGLGCKCGRCCCCSQYFIVNFKFFFHTERGKCVATS